MPETLLPDDFQDLDAPLRVQVRIGDTTRTLELSVESVNPLPAHQLREAPFTVILVGPADVPLPQATYPLEHPRLGSVGVFLVPIARDAVATRYEVTFN